jgi:hypothetical protein
MNDNTGNPFENAPVIFAYTRAMALADGVLVELKQAPRYGFRLQVVCTERVWLNLLSGDHAGQPSEATQQREGALLFAAKAAARAKVDMERAGVPDARPDRMDFTVTVTTEGESPREVPLYMLIHPDDDGSMRPVATLMFVDED